jgi:uncharacterized protein
MIILKRILRYILGIAFLILGVIGLFLPILQGILFLIVGLLILAPESKWIRALLAKLRARYPKIFEAAERIKHKFSGTRPTGNGTDTPK